MRNKKGFVLAYAAIILLPIISIGALLLDASEGYSLKSRIKNAIDFSALAGISQLANDNSETTSARNIALNYLNNNLTMSIPNFELLSLNSDGLSIITGTYNSNTMAFSPNSPDPHNAIMISYIYEAMTFIDNIFMVNSYMVSDSTTAVKQTAGRVAPGGGFPLAINSSTLSLARNNANNLDLIQSGTNENSYFTAFDSSNASANNIKNIIRYFEDQTVGIKPPALSIGETFQINNGSLTSIYNTLDSNSFIGKTFISPIVTLENGFTNLVRVDGFVGFTINNIYKDNNEYHIEATIIPGYVDNKWSGIFAGPSPNNISPEDQTLLANSFGLIN